MMPPVKVLHAELLNYDPVSIYKAISSDEAPMVVTTDYNMESKKVKEFLINSGLWMLN